MNKQLFIDPFPEVLKKGLHLSFILRSILLQYTVGPDFAQPGRKASDYSNRPRSRKPLCEDHCHADTIPLN